MSRIHRSHFNRIAALASGAMLLLGGSALAQTVSVFDDAPSIEQLRGIMIPESLPGASRSIVMQRPDVDVSPSAVQRVSSQDQAPARPAAARVRTSPAPSAQAAASGVEPKAEASSAGPKADGSGAAPTADASGAGPKAEASGAGPKAKTGAVAFHVNFGFDSVALPDSAHEMIDVIAQLMKETPEIRVRIEGHTDAVGSVPYNISLSERRALSVGEYLVKQGIDPSRLELVGKGMAEPLTANKYDPANRRVQFVRIA